MFVEVIPYFATGVVCGGIAVGSLYFIGSLIPRLGRHLAAICIYPSLGVLLYVMWLGLTIWPLNVRAAQYAIEIHEFGPMVLAAYMVGYFIGVFTIGAICLQRALR